MRYKFIILFLLIGFVSKAQVYQLMPQYGYSTYRMNFDSTIQIPTFCGVPKLGSNKTNKGALAFDSCNNRFYYFNPKFQVWDTIKSADASLFVKYTDTASLVAPYLRKGDTIFLSQRIDQRVKYTDTSAMLMPYLRAVDTTNKWVNSVTKLNDSTIQVIKGITTSNITISSVTSATRLITQVWNNTGATILRGSVVYISGRHSSNLPTIALAEGNNESNSYKTFALVDGDIADNSSGFVIQAGKILGLNLPTSSYTDGDILYLSPTVPGGYTKTKPLAPNHIVKLGSVTRAHPTQGSIEIKIENGWQLDELSDVQIAAVPADSTLLQFSRVDSLWHDVSPLTAMGNRFVKTTDSSAMLQPYLRKIDTASISNRINLKLNISDTTNTWITSVFRKTASDSVFFVRGGSNNFAFRDSAGGANIYNTDGTLTGNRTLSLGGNNLNFSGNGRIAINTSSPFGKFNIEDNNILAISNDTSGLYLSNLTTATNGNAKSSPSIVLEGQSWKTGSPASSVSAKYRIINEPSTFTNGGGKFAIQNSVNNISYTDMLSFSGQQTSQTATITANSTSITGVLSVGGTITSTSTNGEINATGSNGTINAGGTSIASAVMSATSTTKGFLQPRMTTTQMNAISTPATGLSVFNTTDSSEYVYRGTGGGWQRNFANNNFVFSYGGVNGAFAISDRSFTGNGNTIFGNMTSSITGLNNTLIGFKAGNGTGTDGNNIAIGKEALLLGGQRCTAIGSEALKSKGGSGMFDHVGIGYLAGASISSGTNSIFIGNNSAQSTTRTDNSIYLGHSSLGLSTTQGFDEIVIGANTTGNGSRTLTLGQNAINETYLKGVVSLGRNTGTRQTMNAGALLDMSSTTHGLLIPRIANTTTIGRSVNTFTRVAGSSYTNGTYQNIALTGGTGANVMADLTISGGQVTAATITNGGGGYSVGDTLRAPSTQIGAGNGGFYLLVTGTNNPPTGLQVFNTTDSSQYVYRGTGAGWQQIANEIVNTASLNFPSTNAQNSSDLTITLTGAVDGDAVVLGVPNAAVNANSCYTAWVSAANTVTVRFNNYSSGAIDPAQATFRVTIIK